LVGRRRAVYKARTGNDALRPLRSGCIGWVRSPITHGGIVLPCGKNGIVCLCIYLASTSRDISFLFAILYLVHSLWVQPSGVWLWAVHVRSRCTYPTCMGEAHSYTWHCSTCRNRSDCWPAFSYFLITMTTRIYAGSFTAQKCTLVSTRLTQFSTQLRRERMA
jgi:hypothetical protein